MTAEVALNDDDDDDDLNAIEDIEQDRFKNVKAMHFSFSNRNNPDFDYRENIYP